MVKKSIWYLSHDFIHQSQELLNQIDDLYECLKNKYDIIDYATSPTLHSTIEKYHHQLCDLNRKYMYVKCNEVNGWIGLDRLIDSHSIAIINAIKQRYSSAYSTDIDDILLHDISQFLKELFSIYSWSLFEECYTADGMSYDIFLHSIISKKSKDSISCLQEELIKCCINSNSSHALSYESYHHLHSLIQSYINTNFYTTIHDYIEKIYATRRFLFKELVQYKDNIRQEIEK